MRVARLVAPGRRGLVAAPDEARACAPGVAFACSIEAAAGAARPLDGLGIAWSLVGGLAASARTTRDDDVAVVTASDEEAGALTFGLRALGYRSVAVVEHLRAGRMATAPLRVPGATGLLLDLLFASCGMKPELARDTESPRNPISAGKA